MAQVEVQRETNGHGEVDVSIRHPDHGQRWQGMCVLEQDVIERQHDLLGFQPDLIRHLFERVDLGAVEIRLAGFPQAVITDRDAKALKQALKRRRPAIHCGGLNHFRN